MVELFTVGFYWPIAEEVSSPVGRRRRRQAPHAGNVLRTYRLFQPSPTRRWAFVLNPFGDWPSSLRAHPHWETRPRVFRRGVFRGRPGGAETARRPSPLGRTWGLDVKSLLPGAPIELGERVSTHPALRAGELDGRLTPSSFSGWWPPTPSVLRSTRRPRVTSL